MDTKIIDKATAESALRAARDRLADALAIADETMSTLRDTIIQVRPSGLLAVEDMAAAIDRDRNYIDSVWSNFGETSKGRQTRVTIDGDDDEVNTRTATMSLSTAARAQRVATDRVTSARADRDRTVAMVYASKLLGPTAIASEVRVDRNHVLRIARRAGVAPMHRQGSRNQYSV